jgi:ribonuclease Z
MKIYIQILGTETGDSTPGILVFFDQKRYLFNCGEGTQRFCIEHKVRLARVDHIFVTQLSWDYIGGIPGGLLSLYEMGLKNINLFGPKGLKNFLEACRYFFQRPDMTFRIREFEDTDFFQDENLKIIPIILNPQKSDTFSRSSDEKTTFADSESDDVYFTDPEETLKVASSVSFDEKTKFYTMQLTQPLPNVAKKRKISETKNTREWTQSHGEQNDSTSECATPRTCSKDASFLSLVSTILQHRYKNRPFVRMSPRLSPSTQSPSHTVVSYVCHTPTVPGKFNVQKALQLGVPKGPLFGALRRGETVTLDNGTVVRPSDCIEPDVPGAILIVVHCPSIDYLASLCSHSALTPYLRPGDPQQSTGSMNHSNNSQNHWRYVKCVVHITPLEVLTTPAYSKWMNSFEESAHHIVINKEICKQQLIFRSAAIHSIKLNFVHSELFPKPKYTSTPACSINDLFKKDNVPKWVVAAEPLMKFHLCPLSAIGLDVSELLSDFNEQEILQSLQADEQLKNTIKQQQSLIIEAENNPNDEKLIQPQPTIVFLGTGAAMPSKYRNGILFLISVL